ncbi:hypothetical protein GCM10011351_31410 [Paraliobacillus quinghaiensis]|uniref:Uncharacterized protein n=2 Tax=Paraliobacillus quinghaiensis TaxID=470815 RepID=A0A917TXK7_9BACI|nr:hypothetical protein GCM10011351_31410 [Paraliobacillus quinghaiensis]
MSRSHLSLRGLPCEAWHFNAEMMSLEYYYDLLYSYSANQLSDNEKIIIRAANIDEAVQLVRDRLAHHEMKIV